MKLRALPILAAWVAAALAWTMPGAASAGEADDKIAAIGATLDRFHAAASRADTEAYFALFAPDGVFIGTDSGERWPVAAFRAYAEPFFAKGQGWTYKPRMRHVTLADIPCGCVAWFDELLDNPKYGTSRGTGVLIAGSDGWKIEQYALTFPIPNPLAAGLTGMIRDFEARQKEPAKP
jgi:hypothetical protein